ETPAPAPEPAADSGYGFFDAIPTPTAEGEPAAAASEAKPVEGAGAPPKLESVETPRRRATDKPGATAQAESSTIRVDVDKVDMLINLVGELVITQAMLAQNTANIDPVAHENLLNGLVQLERNTRDLQESVMSIRMMPMSFVFSRFPRVVRDTAGKLGKQVELKTEGESTELDKSLIEKLTDPLTHLVRNSLDHGIEAPDTRIAAGKSAHGTLTLRAFQQGGNIYVEVKDDGAGLNREKILAKAREKGMNVSDTMSDQDVYALIFEAGFSTAEKVTDVSGRGVGMDVVRRNIREMGGSVEIDSSAGRGTRITIRLPLTLAILDGLSVSVGGETFIIPLTHISESLQPNAADIKTVSGHGLTVHVRGDYLPVIALHEVFGIKPHVTELEKGIMVILESERVRSALFVDALLGEHQVVIKSLETNYRRVPGVAGATIMGDGRVALILDAAALPALAQGRLLEAA
ncbi:MAG: chemotaxis protein CheW, partial [Pseudomonadota bacterium]